MSEPEGLDFQDTPASERKGAWPYAADSEARPPVAVSIVTPYFNAGGLFGETVLSVRRQSFQAWEWIVVDDGSTDEASVATLAGTAAGEPRMRVIRLAENLGLSAARNRGLAEAAGEFVCWLDADDLLEPTFIEKCLWVLLSTPQLAFANGFTVGFGAERYLWRHGFHDRERFLEENWVNPTSVMRTGVARGIGGFDETLRRGLEDWDFWLRAADRGHWGRTITEPLSWYRCREAHLKEWKNLRVGRDREELEKRIRARYPRLASGAFPRTRDEGAPPPELASLAPPANPLLKGRPRALVIVPHLDLGGADRFNLDLIAQLARRHGWEITVVTTRRSEDPWQQTFRELTSDVFMLPRFLPFWAFPAFIAYLVESRQPDVAYLSHSELGYRLLPWLKEAFPTLPVVDLVHIVVDEWKDGGFPRFSCAARPWLARTVATSQALRRWLVEHGAPGASVEVVYTGVDAACWKRSAEMTDGARATWKIPADRPVLLYAARFAAQKQPRLLPEIVQKLAARGRRFVLLLAGDGPERPWLEEYLCERHPGLARMLGPVDPDEMRSVMSASDLLVLPSSSEGIALVLFEAMSMGVVPVATDVGGQRELVTPDCGVLLPADERLADAMVDALDALLADEPLRRRLAAAGRKRVEERFRLDQMGERMNAILRGEIRGGGPRIKSQAAAVGSGGVAGELAELHADDLRADAWNRRLQEGSWVLSLVSRGAGWLRRSPLRRWFRRFEIRHGTRVGRWLVGPR